MEINDKKKFPIKYAVSDVAPLILQPTNPYQALANPEKWRGLWFIFVLHEYYFKNEMFFYQIYWLKEFCTVTL